MAKNYLTEPKLTQLSRLVNAYLDVAEDMALRKLPMTMQDWETRLNRFLAATNREVLRDAGKVTDEIARAQAESEFEKYRIVQDRLFESDFDRVVAETKRLGEGKPRKGGGRSRDPRAGPRIGVQQSRAPHVVRAHVRGAARAWAMLPTMAIGVPTGDSMVALDHAWSATIATTIHS